MNPEAYGSFHYLPSQVLITLGMHIFKNIFHYSSKLLDKIFTPSSFSFNAYVFEVTLLKPFPNQLTREAPISAQSVNCSPSEPSFLEATISDADRGKEIILLNLDQFGFLGHYMLPKRPCQPCSWCVFTSHHNLSENIVFRMQSFALQRKSVKLIYRTTDSVFI